MKKDSLHFIPLLVLILALALSSFVWYQSSSFEKAYLERVEKELLIRSRLLQPKVKNFLTQKDLKGLNKYCKQIDQSINTRVTIIDSTGKVLGDSRGQVDLMAPHKTADRKEIIDAFKGFQSASIRNSSTLSTRMIYAAIPVKCYSQIYVLRTSMAIGQIDNIIFKARRDILIFGFLVAASAFVVSYFIVKTIRTPIKDLRINAARIASGDLDTKLPIPPKGAIHDLAQSLSNMAEQLKKRLEQVSLEKKKRDAIFASMAEGVIAVDLKGDILDINRSAIEMLELPGNPKGLSLYTLVDNEPLRKAIKKITKDKELLESEITLHTIPERRVRVCGTALSSKGTIFGAVIVLFDITQMKKLENFRSDFIADVSHEIKTPLTAIRGAVETLAEGAINEPDNARKFMKIITKHSDRLNSLVHDILSLSHLELKTGSNERGFATLKLSSVINTACEICHERAGNKNIKFKVMLPKENCELFGDCQLLEQAVINLLENAVKYSEAEKDIEISATCDKKEVEIKVRDYGVGITAEHLPRLFERFYRVDKARSRKLGGTGLGLAIVKHIAQLHSGSISVESQPGKGSTFTLRLPIKKAQKEAV